VSERSKPTGIAAERARWERRNAQLVRRYMKKLGPYTMTLPPNLERLRAICDDNRAKGMSDMDAVREAFRTLGVSPVPCPNCRRGEDCKTCDNEGIVWRIPNAAKA
jgi:hypothetical protein